MPLQPALHSPALSTSSSFDFLSSLSSSVSFSEPRSVLDDETSEDEIVWTLARDGSGSHLSDSDELTDGSGYSSDEDLVLISRHRSAATQSLTVDEYTIPSTAANALGDVAEKLTGGMSQLKLKDNSEEAEKKQKKRKRTTKKRRERRKAASASAKASTEAPIPTKPKARSMAAKDEDVSVASSPRGLGSRSLVDDISERLSVVEEPVVASKYDEATRFISSYLANPQAQLNTAYRLTLLQSLIIELGLATSALPTTLTSARAYLRSKAFLNIREYLAVRGQGPEAMQKLLHPSKSSLVRNIRKTNNRTSLKWVKEHGLQVLLVSCFH